MKAIAAPRLTSSYWPAQDEGTAIEEITTGEALRRAATDAPAVVALVEGIAESDRARRWTYAELYADARRTAHALLALLEPGARFAVWANNLPEWILLEYAAGLAGMTLVTVNPALRPAELRHVLGQSRAEALFLLDEYRGASMPDTLAEVRADLPHLRHVVRFADWDDFIAAGNTSDLPRVGAADPAQVQYTSGTTGEPKGAVLHHRGIVNNARLTANRFGLERGHVLLSPMPLFHTAGCVVSALGALAARATLVLPPAFEAGLCLTLIEREQVDSLMAVPTMLLAVLEHEAFEAIHTSGVRRVLSGGTIVSPDLVREVRNGFGASCTIAFAQTEASPVITQTCADDTDFDLANTLGWPLPWTEVKIADRATRATLPLGETGEICTRGYHVMTGYLDRPEMTAAVIDADGWLYTGDLGSMDDRGYLRIEGRLKDMIIRGGENIYPREIEQVLSAHPGVGEAAVVGLPDPKWGERVAAFVRLLDDDLTEQDLAKHCRETLASHKVPRRWTFVDSLPLTSSGKVQKHLLREKSLAED